MNTAEHFRQDIGSAVAWSMPVYFRVRVSRKIRNQFGTSYRFEDGSRVFVEKGSALIHVCDA